MWSSSWRRSFNRLKTGAAVSTLVAAPYVAAKSLPALRCAEPEAEPGPNVRGGAPPQSQVRNEVSAFLRSSAGKDLVKQIVDEWKQQSKNEFQSACRDAIARAQSDISYAAEKSAKDAAEAAARREVERLPFLVQGLAKGAVSEEARAQLPRLIRDDPSFKAALVAHIDECMRQVHEAAHTTLKEICEEDRYHHVNRAFLDALQRKCDKIVEKTKEDAMAAAAAQSRSILITQLLGVAALGTAAFSLVKLNAKL
eukprot:TRINITY_DN7132_c0_g1_i2.p1 TRINITY_DN7132_c0_g1~~TRINITY_DN7132_c0_g1_i2.p1  ORF type:complete len:254 (+),score=53.24 TRINITY_DN7132_c0_g1_i2:75-836(+)